MTNSPAQSLVVWDISAWRKGRIRRMRVHLAGYMTGGAPVYSSPRGARRLVDDSASNWFTDESEARRAATALAYDAMQAALQQAEQYRAALHALSKAAP